MKAKDTLRKPKAPPFKVGTKLRYIGTRHVTASFSATGPKAEILAPGMVVTVERVELGRQGTGRQLRDEDGPMFYEDDGEPILDTTKDGYSVYSVPEPSPMFPGHRHGRCILVKNKHEWQVVKDES